MQKHRTAAADENAVVVRSGKTKIGRIRVTQKTNDAPVLYLQLFNHASPTVGTTAPNMVLRVPAGIANQFAFQQYRIEANKGGDIFGTALTFAVTAGHDNAVAPDAGDEPEVEIFYDNVP